MAVHMVGKNAPSTFFFMKEYVKHFRQTGSLVPDSKRCLRSLLRHVPFDSAKVILEFGSGSGKVSREIIRRKRARTTLVCLEKNGLFYNRLARSVCGCNVHLAQADVLDGSRIVERTAHLQRGKVDCIISTLPCSSLNFNCLLKGTVLPLLRPDGVFVQYMHTLSYLKGFSAKHCLQKRFDRIRTDLVWLNLPPTLVYTCSAAIPG
jgi:phospholipid N-methyltransferase